MVTWENHIKSKYYTFNEILLGKPNILKKHY